MSEEQIAVSAAALSKAYPTYQSPVDLAIEFLTGRNRHGELWALKNVSFEVPKGEVLGIIGRNGSGKSTLLKIVAGLLDHSGGTIQVNGTVTAILELGSGFHPDFTGRENIITGGLCLGMSRGEIERKADSIVEFSGIGDFSDRPFRTYSSGMKARITFATAVAVEPEILIIDEALATGDAAFVQKSFAKVRSLCEGGRTVIIVSHSTSSLAQICDRVMWLDDGAVRSIGEPLDVIREYDLDAHVRAQVEMGTATLNRTVEPRIEKQPPLGSSDHPSVSVFKSGPVEIESIHIYDGRGEETSAVATDDKMRIVVKYRCSQPLPEESLGLAIAVNRKGDLFPVVQCSTVYADNLQDIEDYDGATFRKPPSTHGAIEAEFSSVQLEPGDYVLSVGLLPNLPGRWHFYEYHHFAYPLRVTGTESRGGLFRPLITWEHKES